LKTNSFSGNTEILETGHKITGVSGLKWGTKMMDKENNTLLKIRNENQFINTNKYEIEISNEEVTDLDIFNNLIWTFIWLEYETKSCKYWSSCSWNTINWNCELKE